jgi:hypothetical protein
MEAFVTQRLDDEFADQGASSTTSIRTGGSSTSKSDPNLERPSI